MAPEIEVPLNDTSQRKVVRIGRHVHRPTYPWSDTIHVLLRHLEEVGFAFSPRFRGIDATGREVLGYIEGDAGPAGWSRIVHERGLVNAAMLLRHYHQAVWRWQPPDHLVWPNGKMGGGDPGDLICHGDFGPWNIVWNGIRPVGLLDWDYAYPGDAIDDLVYALEYMVPFRDDEECVRNLSFPEPPNRHRRLELFAGTYGMTEQETRALPDRVIGGQRRMLEQVRTLADQGIQPQQSWVRGGYLDVIERRIRWCEQNLARFK